MTHRIVLACLAVMVAAALAADPLGMVGWDKVAGVVFILAMLTAWGAAAAGRLGKFWRG